MTTEQTVLLVLPLFVSLLVAVLTPLVTARMTSGRVEKIWKLERSRARLDFLQQYVHHLVQSTFLVEAAELLAKTTGKSTAPIRRELLAANLEAVRSLASVYAVTHAIDDEELLAAVEDFEQSALEASEGDEARRKMLEKAGRILKRCYDLLEAGAQGKP